MREQNYNKPLDKLCIKTPVGDLVAEVGGDPAYPELFIWLEKDTQVEFTLACVGWDQDRLKIRIKEEIPAEDLSLCAAFTQREIERAEAEVLAED